MEKFGIMNGIKENNWTLAVQSFSHQIIFNNISGFYEKQSIISEGDAPVIRRLLA